MSSPKVFTHQTEIDAVFRSMGLGSEEERRPFLSWSAPDEPYKPDEFGYALVISDSLQGLDNA